jgi:O-antigen/teichoic acid export membrane protein
MVVGLVGNIVLARFLMPEEFGQFGIAMFFVVISNVLIESGFSGALIRLKKVEEKDYSTIFVFNLIISIILYVLLIVFSNNIAAFYNDKQLTSILIVIGSILVFNAFQITQNAKLVKGMMFRKRALYKFISLFLATIVAIVLAVNNYGIWALVFLQVLSSFFLSIILSLKVKNSFSFKFDKVAFKKMYSFGMNTTIASVVNTAFENGYQLIIGKYFSLAQVGVFYQAKRLQEVPDALYKNVILNVFYSKLANYQENIKEFHQKYIEMTIHATIVIGLSTTIVTCFSEEVIDFVYGSKWQDSAFFLKLLSISSFFYLIEICNRNIFKVFNKTNILLGIEILKKIVQSITIFIGIYFHSLEYLMYGYLFTTIFSLVVNYYYAKKVLSVLSFKGLIPIGLVLFIVVLLYILITSLNNYLNYNFYVLVIELIIVTGLYILLLFLFKITSVKKIKNILKK